MEWFIRVPEIRWPMFKHHDRGYVDYEIACDPALLPRGARKLPPDIDAKLRRGLVQPSGAESKWRPRFVFQTVAGSGYLACTHAYQDSTGRVGWIAHVRGAIARNLNGRALQVYGNLGWHDPETWNDLFPDQLRANPNRIPAANGLNYPTRLRLRKAAQLDFFPPKGRQPERLVLIGSSSQQILWGLCVLLDEIQPTPNFSSWETYPLTEGINIAGMLSSNFDTRMGEKLKEEGVAVIELSLDAQKLTTDLHPLGQPTKRPADERLAPQKGEITPQIGAPGTRTHEPLERPSKVSVDSTSATATSQPGSHESVPSPRPPPAEQAPTPPANQSAASPRLSVERALAAVQDDGGDPKYQAIARDLANFDASELTSFLRELLSVTNAPSLCKASVMGVLISQVLNVAEAALQDPATSLRIENEFNRWKYAERLRMVTLCLTSKRWHSAFLQEMVRKLVEGIAKPEPLKSESEEIIEDTLRFIDLIVRIYPEERDLVDQAHEIGDLLRIKCRNVTLELINRAIRRSVTRLKNEGTVGPELATGVEDSLNLGRALVNGSRKRAEANEETLAPSSLVIEIAALTLSHETDVPFEYAFGCLFRSGRRDPAYREDAELRTAYDRIRDGHFTLRLLQQGIQQPFRLPPEFQTVPIGGDEAASDSPTAAHSEPGENGVAQHRRLFDHLASWFR